MPLSASVLLGCHQNVQQNRPTTLGKVSLLPHRARSEMSGEQTPLIPWDGLAHFYRFCTLGVLVTKLTLRGVRCQFQRWVGVLIVFEPAAPSAETIFEEIAGWI